MHQSQPHPHLPKLSIAHPLCFDPTQTPFSSHSHPANYLESPPAHPTASVHCVCIHPSVILSGSVVRVLLWFRNQLGSCQLVLVAVVISRICPCQIPLPSCHDCPCMCYRALSNKRPNQLSAGSALLKRHVLRFHRCDACRPSRRSREIVRNS